LKKVEKRHKKKKKNIWVRSKSRDLYLEGKKSFERKNKKRAEEHAKRVEKNIEEVEYFFEPKINPRSREYVRNNFEERQRNFSKRKSKTLRNLKKKVECTFKPKLNSKSREILDEKNSRCRNKSLTARARSKRKRRDHSVALTARSIDSNRYIEENSFYVKPLKLGISDYIRKQSISSKSKLKSKKANKALKAIFKSSKYTPSIKSHTGRGFRYAHEDKTRSKSRKIRNNFDDDDREFLENLRVPFSVKKQSKKELRKKEKSVTNRLYPRGGKENRRSVMVAAKPQKRGQRALSFKENYFNGRKLRNLVNLEKSRSKGKLKSMRKKVKTINQIEFEQFEKFCETLGESEDLEYESRSRNWGRF
jgi:hypothetical protein